MSRKVPLLAVSFVLSSPLLYHKLYELRFFVLWIQKEFSLLPDALCVRIECFYIRFQIQLPSSLFSTFCILDGVFVVYIKYNIYSLRVRSFVQHQANGESATSANVSRSPRSLCTKAITSIIHADSCGITSANGLFVFLNDPSVVITPREGVLVDDIPDLAAHY